MPPFLRCIGRPKNALVCLELELIEAHCVSVEERRSMELNSTTSPVSLFLHPSFGRP